MTTPLFSILVPAYKDKFFKECIDSILAQTYKNFELIIVNDASPYHIHDIMEQYDDPRIDYHVNEKGYGAVDLVKNWNHGLEYVKGDYVICMGDDDRLLPSCLEEYKKLIEKYPNCDIFHTQTQIINEQTEVIDLQSNRPEHESVYAMIWHYMKGRRQFIGDWLFKSATLKKNGGFFNTPCAWGADDVTTFIAARNTGVVNMNTFGFQYRKSSYTISSSNYAYEKAKAYKIFLEWSIQFLKTIPEDETDQLYHHFLQKAIPTYIRALICNHLILDDLYEKPNRFFKWFKRRKEFSISTRELLGIFHGSLIKRGIRI